MRLPLITILLGFLAAPWASAERDEASVAADDRETFQPDEAFLAFLVEFGETDDETFELMVHHGKQDSELEELQKLAEQEAQLKNPSTVKQTNEGDGE